MDCFIKNNYCYAFFLILFFCACKKEKLAVLHTEISSPTTFQLSQIKFISPQIGFACGGHQFEKSELIRTLDGGESWHIIPLPQNVPGKQLYALDALPNGTLHTAGFDGVTYVSTDTGNTITFQQDYFYGHWRSIAFRTQHNAMLCGRDNLGKGFLISIQEDKNWAYPFAEDFYSYGMYHITFADSLVGYIAGFGAISKTIDGGKSWNFTTAKNDYFTSTQWFSTTEGVAIGWEGTILKTTDGGDNWEQIRNGNKVAQKRIGLKCLTKNSANELVAAGEKGCILYSNDKGASWKELENFTDVNFESISFRDEDTFFVVGDDGRIFKVEI